MHSLQLILQLVFLNQYLTNRDWIDKLRIRVHVDYHAENDLMVAVVQIGMGDNFRDVVADGWDQQHAAEKGSFGVKVLGRQTVKLVLVLLLRHPWPLFYAVRSVPGLAFLLLGDHRGRVRRTYPFQRCI